MKHSSFPHPSDRLINSDGLDFETAMALYRSQFAIEFSKSNPEEAPLIEKADKDVAKAIEIYRKHIHAAYHEMYAAGLEDIADALFERDYSGLAI